MLFAKKKNLKFEEMEHVESPDLSELEATLDFLKKTPEKREADDKGDVLHPLPAIEPPKLDADKNPAVGGAVKAEDSTSVTQDISFDDDSSENKDLVNKESDNEVKEDPSAIDISEEIIKKAETLREKQLLNDSVNSEAELALKKDESNITKTDEEASDVPKKEVSDAVKAAMALQAEHDSKMKTMTIDPRRSRFMKRGSTPVKKAEEPASEKNEDRSLTSKEEAAGEVELTAEIKTKEAVKEKEKTETVELTEKAEKAALEEISEDSGKSESENNSLNDDTKTSPVKETVKTEDLGEKKAVEKSDVSEKKGASTAITSNLRLPNDVIVSNIESSARSMGKYAGAAKIANPLPHPKKHITRNMDFDYPVSAAQMHFDIEDLNGMDFFDIDD